MKYLINKPFYPIFFCVYPILYLAARNVKIIALADPVRPLLIALGVTALLLLTFRLILKEWDRPAQLTSLMLVLFFSFGHVAGTFPSIPPGLLVWVWIGIFLIFYFFILSKGRAARVAPFLNTVGAALVGISLGSFVISALTLHGGVTSNGEYLAQMRGEAQAEASGSLSPGPDIYYIILDSYERADGLEKYYGFDNSDFIQALKDRGFYVAEQSRANYLTTAYALPTALNMVYLNQLPRDIFVRVTSGLQVNHVVDFLHKRGYQTVHFESGFPMVDRAAYDIWVSPTGERLQPRNAPINQFELLLLHTSPGYLLLDSSSDDPQPLESVSEFLQQDFAARRARLEHAFTHLPDYAAADGNYFLFAHMVAPHNPYIYGPNGEHVDYDGNSFLLGDKTDSRRNIRLYNDQLQYVNRRVLALVDRILAELAEPPVIILQADHGHDTFFEWDAVTPEGIDLRSAILNAAYFPDGDYSALYPSISPVNTFRVVFNHYFDTRYPLLPDRTYGHPHPNTIPSNSMPVFVDMQPYLNRLPAK